MLDGVLDRGARERLAGHNVNVVRHMLPGYGVMLAGTRSGLLMRRALQLVGVNDATGRERIDAEVMALPPDRADLGVYVHGADNSDGVLAVRADADGLSPALLVEATLRHGADVLAGVIAHMDAENPPATRSVVAGGLGEDAERPSLPRGSAAPAALLRPRRGHGLRRRPRRRLRRGRLRGGPRDATWSPSWHDPSLAATPASPPTPLEEPHDELICEHDCVAGRHRDRRRHLRRRGDGPAQHPEADVRRCRAREPERGGAAGGQGGRDHRARAGRQCLPPRPDVRRPGAALGLRLAGQGPRRPCRRRAVQPRQLQRRATRLARAGPGRPVGAGPGRVRLEVPRAAARRPQAHATASTWPRRPSTSYAS